MTDAILKLLRLYIDLPEDEKLGFLKELRKLEAMDIEVKKDYERILKSL
ncbi:hypothetical protein MUK70_10930 [Dyadobacter chenwenxiniae]|uniref:Uncharacterized protein n=1 Tax=Dyadobacter chenwenxiniae TaxID=2906456 RepID=A0A9X1PRB8_9BACT|nr:hypothetical protein [Dyadobacter chenwenxiniae]MCF0065588.1 hypothetical protein [Dyadobacter chenwenxiniae]UON85499.1 hypothetical protein MUK70_10930 [Dyadobacter chenwenxiniae]